jgi:UDP-glucuronate decarboxylase
VVSNFIVQALAGKDITIYGDGSQTRSFCYVDDLVDGLIGLMQTDSAITGPVNLGNPVECNIMELAERIVTLTGSGSKLVYRPLPADDPAQRRPDITLAGELLDWAPAVLLEEGLAATVDYFRAQAGLQEVGQ